VTIKSPERSGLLVCFLVLVAASSGLSRHRLDDRPRCFALVPPAFADSLIHLARGSRCAIHGSDQSVRCVTVARCFSDCMDFKTAMSRALFGVRR
jgi:hypothetical protein